MQNFLTQNCLLGGDNLAYKRKASRAEKILKELNDKYHRSKRIFLYWSTYEVERKHIILQKTKIKTNTKFSTFSNER